MDSNTKKYPDPLKGLRIPMYIFIPFGIIFTITCWTWMIKRQDSLLKEYHKVIKTSELGDKIIKIRQERGFSRYLLADESKIRFPDIFNDKKQNIAGEIEPFDSIYKKKDSDTIIVVRNGRKYYFWIWDR